MRDLHLAGRSPAYGTHGMAATSMPQATFAALEILRAGGNAMDAAIAVTGALLILLFRKRLQAALETDLAS